MFIKAIARENGEDQTLILQCSHCGKLGWDNNAKKTDHYKQNILPAIQCLDCHKNADGNIVAERNGYVGNKIVSYSKPFGV